MPRKGLEPPRCYSLVPETSASTNSATWAFQERKGFYIKNIGHIANGLLDEIEGVIQGHRDGHGFVARDDGEGDIYLPPNEMRAVLHKDRVKARIVRHDRKGRPEGRVVEIVERPPQPIIGRLLHESGVWLVAPEDKRYGQDVLIPKGATGLAKAGQVVVVELTEPPSLYGQPVGRVKEVLGEIDDAGMEIEIAVRKYGVPHEFSDACIGLARALPDKVRPQDKKHRVDLTDIPLVTIDGEDARDFDDAVYCEPAKVGRGKGWRLLVAIADVSNYVETGSCDRRRCLRPRHQRVFPAARDPHAAGETLQRPVLAEPGGRAPVHGLRHAGQRHRRDLRLPVLPGRDVEPRPLHLHRGRRDPGQHARARGHSPQGPGHGPA